MLVMVKNILSHRPIATFPKFYLSELFNGLLLL